MPETLKFAGDKQFSTAALDRADLIVHGRRSHEGQPNSPQRKRIVVTRKVADVADDPSNPKATLWNPATAPFEAACDHAGVHKGTIAIIGGPDVFDMFMDRYDTFWLSQAPNVTLPGGEPVFSGVPKKHRRKFSQATASNPAKAWFLTQRTASPSRHGSGRLRRRKRALGLWTSGP